MIEEVKTDKPAWPCCPLMSGHPVQVTPPQGSIMQANQVAVGPMLVPCVEDRCPLFDAQERVCQLRSVSEISGSLLYMVSVFRDIKFVLEPPKGSPSPLMRIADSLAEIVGHLKKERMIE